MLRRVRAGGRGFTKTRGPHSNIRLPNYSRCVGNRMKIVSSGTNEYLTSNKRVRTNVAAPSDDLRWTFVAIFVQNTSLPPYVASLMSTSSIISIIVSIHEINHVVPHVGLISLPAIFNSCVSYVRLRLVPSGEARITLAW